MQSGKTSGITVIELLICTALCSVLIGYALPSMSRMIKRSEATVAINWLVSAVVFTRHAAVTNAAVVTLCPSIDGQTCSGNWHDGAIAFTDPNRDRSIHGKDRLLRRFEFPVPGATIKWRAFQNRQYLQMLPTGYTNYQNGNFVYCPEDGDLRYARQLVINMQGRTRTSKDTDQDGYVEDRRGRHLRC
jgi:type IV fimbrial biogenesis protein FimT